MRLFESQTIDNVLLKSIKLVKENETYRQKYGGLEK